MSGASSAAADSADASPGEGLALRTAALRTAAAPVRFVGFWAAVALPFLYVPLLYDGLEGGRTIVFVFLVALNALALVAGHGHRRARGEA
ncbi:hypothetical protein [Halegenticoccus tardaugens]|uniref:hypothetical protein n=1 Tax=Halegenticoccus tardaugens TaxID=2071624 RepID=UPI001E44F8C5|nr:hypothetical protein [Halegenticoccus tardaugens]